MAESLASTTDGFGDEWRKMVTEYKKLVMSECTREQAPSDRVERWMISQDGLLAESERRAAAGLPTHDPIDVFRVMAQRGLRTVVARLPWIDAGLREKIERRIETLPSRLVRGPYRYTLDLGMRHYGQWLQLLRPLVGKPDLLALEVGCFEGMSTCWLIDNVMTDPTARLICCDPFEPPRTSETNYAFEQFPDDPTLEQLFDHNVARCTGPSKVIKTKGFSHAVMRTLPLGQFDYIYIDGSHIAPDVLEDAVLAWRLLKVGGIVTFDDYGWEVPTNPLHRPKPGIDAFMTVFEGRFEVLHKDFQVSLKKLA